MTLLKQHLFRHQGHIGAYLVVAGVDPTGVHLFTVHAHGSTDKLPYVTMGSGSLAAMAIFETRWQKNLTREDAVALCSEAVEAGIFNDLGSGSNVDVCVIVRDKVFTIPSHSISSDTPEIYTSLTNFMLTLPKGNPHAQLHHPQRARAQRTILQVRSWHNRVPQRSDYREEGP